MLSKTQKMRAFIFMAFLSLYCFQLSASEVAVSASGSGGGAVSPPRPGARDAFTPTKALRATIVKIDEEKNTITLKGSKDLEITLSIDKKTKFRAEDADDFGGRKELGMKDLVADLGVRVVYRESDKTAVEIKVLKRQ